MLYLKILVVHYKITIASQIIISLAEISKQDYTKYLLQRFQKQGYTKYLLQRFQKQEYTKYLLQRFQKQGYTKIKLKNMQTVLYLNSPVSRILFISLSLFFQIFCFKLFQIDTTDITQL